MEEHVENKPERDEQGRLLPGNTANPNGRPKGDHSVVAVLRDMMASDPDKKKKLAEILWEMSLTKNLKALALLLAYMDGKPAQTINSNTTFPNGIPFSLRDLLTAANANPIPPHVGPEPEPLQP